VVSVPVTDIAVEATGKSISANIVALGALVQATGVVTEDAIRKAVRDRVPRGTEEINLKALKAGMEALPQVSPR